MADTTPAKSGFDVTLAQVNATLTRGGSEVVRFLEEYRARCSKVGLDPERLIDTVRRRAAGSAVVGGLYGLLDEAFDRAVAEQRTATPGVDEVDEVFLARLKELAQDWRYSDEFIGSVVRRRYPPVYGGER